MILSWLHIFSDPAAPGIRAGGVMEVPLFPDKSMHPDGTLESDLFVDEFKAYFDAEIADDIKMVVENGWGVEAYIPIRCSVTRRACKQM